MADRHRERRIGHFEVARHLIDDGFGITIFFEMVPLRVELIHYSDSFDVIAECDEFAPLSPGGLAPTYSLILEELAEEVYDPTSGLTKTSKTYRRVITPYNGPTSIRV